MELGSYYARDFFLRIPWNWNHKSNSKKKIDKRFPKQLTNLLVVLEPGFASNQCKVK